MRQRYIWPRYLRPMLAETTSRMLAPLLVLETAGPLHSRLQLHMLTRLVQREIRDRMHAAPGAREAPYGFGDGHCGMHSGLLDMDIAGSASLVTHCAYSPHEAGRPRHSYRITESGAGRIDALKAGAEPAAVRHIEGRIRDMCEAMPAALLEETYGMPGHVEGAARTAEQARAGLKAALDPILDVCRRTDNWRASTFGAMIESARMVLDEACAKPCGGAQMRVILCMTEGITRGCSRIDEVSAAGDPSLHDPHLAEVEDVTANLGQYCERRGVARDPAAVPLSEVISDGTAYALCEELWKADCRS